MGKDTDSSSSDGAHLEHGQPPQAEWKPGKQEWAVMLTLALISLMVALDATILVSVLPTLALDLEGSATDAFWAGTSYLLSCAVCQPFIASLSDIFGRKEMLLLSIIFFTLGTLLCAPVAKDFPVFFVGRSIQGIGGGGIITMGQVIFADIVPLRQRPKYFSLVLAAWALGSVLGPLIGGLFVERVIWAWCFYINFPFCAAGLVLVPMTVKLTTEKTSWVSKFSRVDWVGGFFFIGGLTSFLIGISWAGIQFDWKSAQAITPMVVGIVGVTIAIIWEVYGASEPFLRSSLFHSPSALSTYAAALFQGFILFCALYYVPFYFTAIRFQRPTQSGLDIFPVTCFLLPGSIVISLITTRIGRYRWAIWGGWVVTALGCGLLLHLDVDTPTPVWAVILAIFGIGHGMLLTSVNVGIQAVSRVEDAGRAAAMYAFMRTLGMSIGVAVGGTVFQNVMINKLDTLGLPEAIARNSEAFVRTLQLMDPADPTRITAVQGYLAGFHGVYWTITGAAIAAFFVSLVIRRHSMDKTLESKFVLKGASRPSTASSTASPAGVTFNNATSQSNMTTATEKEPYSIFKCSPVSSVTLSPSSESDGDDDSTREQEQPDEMELDENQIHAEVEMGLAAMAEEEEEDVRDEEASVEETSALAYFIHPGGKVVPVDILSDHPNYNQDRSPGPKPGSTGAGAAASAASSSLSADDATLRGSLEPPVEGGWYLTPPPKWRFRDPGAEERS